MFSSFTGCHLLGDVSPMEDADLHLLQVILLVCLVGYGIQPVLLFYVYCSISSFFSHREKQWTVKSLVAQNPLRQKVIQHKLAHGTILNEGKLLVLREGRNLRITSHCR